MLRPRSNPLGGGQVDEQGRILTPEQVKQRQAVAQALASKASDTSPVGHWSQALNRALQGFTASYDRTQADDSYNRGVDYARDKYENRHSPVLQALAAPMTGASNGLSMGEMPAGPQAEAIMQGLISRGLPEHIAQGFLMNFQDESGLNPGINEISPTVPGSRGGFGLYQLTGPRRTAYEAFAGERGVDPSDTDAQLDWLMHELQGPEAKAAQSIFASQNAGEAGAAIVNNFLRPAPEHRASRAARYSGAPAGAMPYTASAPQGSGSSEIAALLADPWVKEIYGDVLGAEMQQAQGRENAMFEQQLAQQDPMYAAELEAQQLANAKAMRPEQVKPVEVGGVLLDPNTFQPIFDSREGPKPTGNIQEYEYYAQRSQERGEQPMPFEQYQASIARAGSGAASGVGTIPAGYQAITDPLTGQITGLQPIPGGPAELDAEKNAAALQSREQNKANSAAIVAQNIDKAIEQTSGWTAGAGGAIFGQLPGTGATDLRSTVDTIRANIGFDRLQQMRDSSPTGGALGGIAIQELQMLQAVLGSLDQAQSPAQLKENLQRLKAIYEPIAAKAAAYPNAAEFGFEGANGGSKPATTRKRYNPQTGGFE